MPYAVKEIFYTLQGEGLHAGRAAVFCRFAGCNLWSGREADRASAACRFCDTDFVGTDGTAGGKYASAQALAEQIWQLWPEQTLGSATAGRPFVVLTGGEPVLQIDESLVGALHQVGFEIALETNGTLPVPPGIDWICMSPKAGTPIVQTSGHELKLVYPQVGLLPEAVEHLAFEHFLLQPMDGPAQAAHIQAALAYCQAHPRWRLSVQLHKWLQIR
jgi:7-carboxy-7-deazaguanine synthase